MTSDPGGQAGPAAELLDDLDSRPGSVTSLTRTVLGAYLRDVGGWTSIADFSALMTALNITPASTRIAVSRIKKKGVLRSETRDGKNGYALTNSAHAMFSHGDRRINGFRAMAAGDLWLLVSVSLPESERAVRQQLRRRLTFIGCGAVSPGLYICPHFLKGDVAAIVAALGADPHVTMFDASDIHMTRTMPDAATQWWDLDALAERHRAFLKHHSAVVDAERTADTDVAGRDAFARFVPALDEWRIIPYVDPGLPLGLLPSDWPGSESIELFRRVCALFLKPSRVWVRSQLFTGRVDKVL